MSGSYDPEQLSPSEVPAVYQASKYLTKKAVEHGLIEVAIRGSENLPEAGGYIAAYTHHTSWWDIPMVGHAILEKNSYPGRFMAKSEYFANPLARLVMNHLRGFPVNRGTNDAESLEFSVRLLESGHIVPIAPEMGAIKGNEIAEKLAWGIGMISCLADSEIIPVAVHGQRVPLLSDDRLFWFPRTFIEIGSAIPAPEGAEDFTLDNVNLRRPPKELIGLIRQVNSLLRPAMVDVYSTAQQGHLDTYGPPAQVVG